MFKMYKMGYLHVICLIMITLLFACSKKEGCTNATATNYDPDAKKDNGSCTFVVNANPFTQAQLDAVTMSIDTGFTGNSFVGAIAHDGTENPNTSTIRDVFASVSKTSTINTVAIISKRIYKKGSMGQRDTLRAVTIMVKQPSGYFSEGGDWEYILIPIDGSTNLSTNSNGLLSKAMVRGKLNGECSSCHYKATGGDFLFSR